MIISPENFFQLSFTVLCMKWQNDHSAHLGSRTVIAFRMFKSLNVMINVSYDSCIYCIVAFGVKISSLRVESCTWLSYLDLRLQEAPSEFFPCNAITRIGFTSCPLNDLAVVDQPRALTPHSRLLGNTSSKLQSIRALLISDM